MVLPGLTCRVRAGAVTGLLGPSGGGKTTMMRSIVGTQMITSGRVTVLGQAAGSAGLRGRVGYSSQAASVYTDLSVHDNLTYFAAALGAPRGDVERVIEQVDLAPFAGQLTGRLSGGQRSRVSLGVALLGAPEVLVLDEPTTGLDPLLREDLWTIFRALAASGITVLVSSHVMSEADRCDELILLRDGALVAQSTPAQFKQRGRAASMDEAFLNIVREDPSATANEGAR